jgi:hypothetical protein
MRRPSTEFGTNGSEPKPSVTRQFLTRLANAVLRENGSSIQFDTDDSEPSSSAYEEYIERDKTGWSDSAREEIDVST